jgi:hypothetical protein
MCIVLVPLIILSALFLPLSPVLELRSEGARLILPLRDGEEFGIRYNHSVNRSPVIDTIQREGDQLVVRRSLFQTYGAGIPILDDAVGTEYYETEAGFVLDGIDASHDEIALLTGTYADHHLLYRDQEIRLKKIFGEMELVRLHIRSVSLCQLLFSA